MTLRNLEIFITVVEAGTMRGAADRLFISQPSVSGAISEMEKECGTKLFERMNKKLFITLAGEKLLKYARRMVNLNQEIHYQMEHIEANTRLRIGATVTVGTCVMTDVIQKMEEISPYVFVNNTHEIEHQLLTNQLDIALVEGTVQSEELLVVPTIADELVLVCEKHHPLAQKQGVTLQDIEGALMILREKGSGTRQSFEDVLQDSGVSVELLWECNNTEAILNAVKKGFGMTVISKRLVEGRKDLVAISFSDCNLHRYFSLVYHKDKYISSRIQGFMALCSTFAKE